ncbi:MAG TPA: hypothetical protein VJ862_12475 [Rhodanobacteraceae bacterium]|nr:hypothetical protein [Rhodanobacteraceae bacterium]
MNKPIFNHAALDKRILGAALGLLCGATAFAIPAVAQQAPTETHATSQATPANPGNARTEAERAVPPLDSRQCIRDTGSHIPPRRGQCLPVAGSSYSAQDIQRTGATNIGQALQMLDPSVTVHGH